MKTVITICLLGCLFVGATFAQSDRGERARARAAAQKAKEEIRARRMAALEGRSGQFDLQFVSDDMSEWVTLEVNSSSGKYRFEDADAKILLNQSGKVDFLGCQLHLTDNPSLVATFNVCGNFVKAFIFSTKGQYTLHMKGAESAEEEEEEEGPH